MDIETAPKAYCGYEEGVTPWVLKCEDIDWCYNEWNGHCRKCGAWAGRLVIRDGCGVTIIITSLGGGGGAAVHSGIEEENQND